MRTDLRYKLTLAAIIALIPLIIAIMIIFLIGASSIWTGLFPVYLFAGAFVLTFILGFVPFMKDHMWLSVTASVLLAGLAGLIFYLI